MSLTYDPVSSLRHYPISMARFGQNPYGENLYRIVFAPSRRHLVYGEWPDGSRKASYCTRYPEPAAANLWVMERWQTPFEYAQCTEAQWNAKFTILGSYPARGEYELCHTFEACVPSEANLEKLISWIEEGRKRSFSENREACQADWDAEQRDISLKSDAIIRNALPSFGIAPMVGRGGGRGTKTRPILKTAQELGLPVGGNKFKAGQTGQRFQVPL